MRTTVGMTPASENPHGTGMHPRIDDPSLPADSLSNDVRQLAPISSRIRFYPIGVVLTQVPGPRIPSDPRDRPCHVCSMLTDLEEMQQIVVLPHTEGADFGLLQDDGSLVFLDDVVGPGFADSLQSDLLWVNGVEPSPLAGRGAAAPASIGLSPDGTTVAERVYLRDGQLLGVADLDVPREDELDGARTLTSSSNEAGLGMSPRVGFQAVYSRAAGKLFVVGGEDIATGAATGDIWWRDVSAGTWMRVPLEGWHPETVLAATRSPRDGRLWVLDEKKTGWMREARLVRIDPLSGEVEELGRWPRWGLFDRHWFVVDRDGSVLLAASSSLLRKHAVVRFEVEADEPPDVTLVRFGRRALAMSPWVDANGYAFPVVVRKRALPHVIRLESLEGRRGRWQDVRHCL